MLLTHTPNSSPLKITPCSWGNYLSHIPWDWEKDINNETPHVATSVDRKAGSSNDSVSPKTGDVWWTHDSIEPVKNILLSCHIWSLEKTESLTWIMNHKDVSLWLPEAISYITCRELFWGQNKTKQNRFGLGKLRWKTENNRVLFECQDIAMSETVSSFISYLLLHNKLPQSLAT